MASSGGIVRCSCCGSFERLGVEPASPSAPRVVTLERHDRARLFDMIKAVHRVTGLSLAEARAIVERAPWSVVVAPSRGEAEAIADRLRAAGGVVRIG